MSDGSLFPVLPLDREQPTVVEVTEIDITAPAITGQPFVRSGEGTTYRIPAVLHDWAIALIARRQNGGPPALPCRIEFGIRDGRAYAQVLDQPPTAAGAPARAATSTTYGPAATGTTPAPSLADQLRLQEPDTYIRP